MEKLIPALGVSLLLMASACSSDNSAANNAPYSPANQTAQHATPTGDCAERLAPGQAANQGESQCADPSATPGTERPAGTMPQ